MPVGLTFAARAYDDRALIEAGLAFEAPGSLRQAPSLA
jgi:Asp-tRNA(Asn)/Glu-tRNA(Gln) amidotransferase A subunit family amidase